MDKPVDHFHGSLNADLFDVRIHFAFEMRRRGVSSPDECDAVALIFAEPVAPRTFRRQIEYPAMGVA